MGRYESDSYSQIENPESWGELGEKVDAYVQTHLAQIAADRKVSKLDTWRDWKEVNWPVNEAKVHGVGVAHVPETLLDYRDRLEHAIADAEVVVTEFAPEAAGFYEPVTKLDNHNVADKPVLQDKLDQYVRDERNKNIGIFHHDIELLAAKYNKPLVCADVSYSRTPEEYFMAADSEQIADLGGAHTGVLKGAETVAAAAAVLPKKFSRRSFLRVAVPAAAGLAVAAYVHHEKHKDDSPFYRGGVCDTRYCAGPVASAVEYTI